MFAVRETPGAPAVLSRKVKIEIICTINVWITDIPRGERERLGRWYFDEKQLIENDIHYDDFYENYEAQPDMVRDGLEEARVLRTELRHIWKHIGPGFKTVWLYRLNREQREGFLFLSFLHTADTPHGEAFRRYLIDFSCDSLIEDNGKTFIKFMEAVIDQDVGENQGVPSLSGKLPNVFRTWYDQDRDDPEIWANKLPFIDSLKWRCAISRTVFACRVLYRVAELWQKLTEPHTGEGTFIRFKQNNYDGSFDDRKTPRVSAPDVDAPAILTSKKSKKKKSKKQAQKAKAAYKLRRKGGRELRSNSSSSGELVREGSSYHGSGDALGTFSTEDINAPFFNDGVEMLSTSDDDSFSHHQDQFIQNGRKSTIVSSVERQNMPSATEIIIEGPDILEAPVTILEPGDSNDDASKAMSEEHSDPVLGIAKETAFMSGIIENVSSSEGPEGHSDTTVPRAIDYTLPIVMELNHGAAPQMNVHTRDNDCPLSPQSAGLVTINASIEQQMDVPELIESSSVFGDQDEPHMDLALPGSPVTPIPGRSPSVKILDDSADLQGDELSLADDVCPSDTLVTDTKAGVFLTDSPAVGVAEAISEETPTTKLVEVDVPLRNGDSRPTKVFVAVPDQIFPKKKPSSNNGTSTGSRVVIALPQAQNTGEEERTTEAQQSHRSKEHTLDKRIKQQVPGLPPLIQLGDLVFEARLQRNGKESAARESQHSVPAVEGPHVSAFHTPKVKGTEATGQFVRPSKDLSSIVFGDLMPLPMNETLDTAQQLILTENPSGHGAASIETVDSTKGISEELSKPAFPFITPEGRFVEDPTVEGKGIQEGEGFVRRVHRKLSDSCSSDEESDGSLEVRLRGMIMRNSPNISLEPSPDSSRRNSEGSLEDRIRDMILHSQSTSPEVSPAMSRRNSEEPLLTEIVARASTMDQDPTRGMESGIKLGKSTPNGSGLSGPGMEPGTELEESTLNNSGPEVGEIHLRDLPVEHQSYECRGPAEFPLELMHIQVEKVPINSVIFSCNTCLKQLNHENSLICPICGVNSATRFCDQRCRFANGLHFKCCTINRLGFEADYVRGPYTSPFVGQGLLTQWRYWQSIFMYEHPRIDFCLFRYENMQYHDAPIVDYALVFDDQKLRDRFFALYQRAMWSYDCFCVKVLWQVVRAWIILQNWQLENTVLGWQFAMEFGDQAAACRWDMNIPTTMPSEAEWFDIESYLKNLVVSEGDVGVNPVTTRYPLVEDLPPIPDWMAERMTPGSCPSMGV